jgi:hypothetical protein
MVRSEDLELKDCAAAKEARKVADKPTNAPVGENRWREVKPHYISQVGVYGNHSQLKFVPGHP